MMASNAQATPLVSTLHVENLKSFRGSWQIELAPLTLIYGPNSAGKSTLLQAVRMIQQYDVFERFSSMEKKDQLRVLHGVDPHSKRWLAEIELLRPLIHDWDWIFRVPRSSPSDSFLEHWMLDEGHITSRDGRRSSDWSPEEKLAHMDQWHMRTREPQVDQLKLVSLRGLIPLDRYVSGYDGDSLSVGIQSERLSFEARLAVKRGSDALRDPLRSSDRVFENLAVTGSADASIRLRELLRKTHFLGPHREGRDTDYPYRDRLTFSEHQDQVVNEWLEKLEVPYQVLSVTVEGLTPEEARALTLEERGKVWAEPHPTETGMRFLRDLRSGFEVGIGQVGYGISQLLPIVDVCVAEPANLILVEQPELHLHPRLQSNLGELFVDAVSRGHQIIAETHSENILLRVCNLIRSGAIHHEEVKVLYVDIDQEGMNVEQIRLGERGEQLDPWSTGFFDDSLKDILGITR